YMEEQFADQQDKARLVAAFRHEMRDIARQVTQFIRKWLDAGVTPLSLDEFLDEHQKVGAVLQRRIQVEESDLYPLY
ncbi:hypothetical protein, partial [Acetobacter senegalensis]|uniref:hypothetical protein n=1 Tax=Acetobacter senegalensis TaxID=446692 RepID=UPI001EDE2120